jgi:hypothetical protein
MTMCICACIWADPAGSATPSAACAELDTMLYPPPLTKGEPPSIVDFRPFHASCIEIQAIFFSQFHAGDAHIAVVDH